MFLVKRGIRLMRVPFKEIQTGDAVFVRGDPLDEENTVTAATGCHLCGDATYSENMFYDTGGDSWFEDELTPCVLKGGAV